MLLIDFVDWVKLVGGGGGRFFCVIYLYGKAFWYPIIYFTFTFVYSSSIVILKSFCLSKKKEVGGFCKEAPCWELVKVRDFLGMVHGICQGRMD